VTVKLRLSQIKLAGFKSFVDPTQIHLPGQIVGVVGPNGCGKSNVIDALRWVLGESKASALRGETMQDVIFNGSDKRRPVARASVELVFDNSQGNAAGQWSSYAEISIKRVLQRSGDSSYLINNQKVRRKDITDIFLGTGLGARAYAIIEQGMISRIIEAKPEELRVFLEEAAGVSKYRDRRRETGLRLDDTRGNLLRVADILQEMDKQLLRLGEQAKVALRYRELEAQRNTAQHLLWLVKKQEAWAQRVRFTQAGDKTRTELEAETARLREIENRLETERGSHQQLSDALLTRQGELYSANAEIARLEQQIKQVAAEQQRLQSQIASACRQISQQQQQRNSATEMLENWQQQQQGATLKQVEAESNAEIEGQHLPQVEAAARDAQQHYHGLQREQLQWQQRLQLAESQHANLQRNIGQIESRRSRLLLEQGKLPRPDTLVLQQAREEQAELEMLYLEQQEQLAHWQEQLPHTDNERHRQRAALQQQERLLAQTEARLHALQQLQNQLDNDKHLQGWLQQHQLDGLPRLWQSITMSNGWEDALEAVLRERLNAFALPDLADAANWDAPPGRLALFAPTRPDSATEVEGQFNPLLEQVQCRDDQVLQALREWLTAIYAVADVAEGYAQRGQLPPGGWFVTPEGHLIGRYSVLFYAPDSQLHGVLSRQSEIVRLEQEWVEQQQHVADTQQQAVAAEQRHQAIELKIPPLRAEVNRLQQRQHALQMQILKLNQEHERSTERALQIARELQEAAESLEFEQEQQQQVQVQRAGAHEALAAFSARVAEAQAQANAHDKALDEQRGRAQQAQHALQEARFFARTCADKIADLRHNLEQIVAGLLLSEQNLAQLQADLSATADHDAAQQLQDALHLSQAREQALSEARNSLEAVVFNRQTLDQARLVCEQQLHQLRDKLNELALKEQEARLFFEQWATQLQGVDEWALLPLTGNAKPTSLQNDLDRLSAAIEALGAVNLAALEELQTATERKAYLDAQALDLQEAMATLEEAIRRIDRESRELLMDTYNQVNLHLAELFPVLFAGGEARLVLTGEEILDSGVQVMAQPPGKKNSSIHLLSGGEKALTAIALIFSLFRLNPAPFCLLDEVDAPLDDSNTERLCALIRKMSLHTQFVFISHNKIAMEMAQQLVGVTMQEKGVSKVVTVDIEAALRMRDELVVA